MKLYSLIFCLPIVFVPACQLSPSHVTKIKKVNQLYQSHFTLKYSALGRTFDINQLTADSVETDTSHVITTDFKIGPTVELTVPTRTQYEFEWDNNYFFLNTGSELVYNGELPNYFDFTGKGYVESKDTTFINAYPSKILIYPGSAINVSNYDKDDGETITLIKGQAIVWHDEKDSGKIILHTPGQQLYWEKGKSAPTAGQSDTSDVLAWRFGQLQIGPCDIKEYLNEIGRWFGKKFLYAENLATEQIAPTTIMLTSPMNNFYKILEVGFGVGCKVRDSGVYVYPLKKELMNTKQ